MKKWEIKQARKELRHLIRTELRAELQKFFQSHVIYKLNMYEIGWQHGNGKRDPFYEVGLKDGAAARYNESNPAVKKFR